MRTSYNKENDDNKDLVVHSSENIDNTQDTQEQQEEVLSIDADYVEVDEDYDDATRELDDEDDYIPPMEEEEEEEDYDIIFSDGKYEPLTPNYRIIIEELEDAILEEESSTEDLTEDEEDLFADDGGEEIEEDLFSDENKEGVSEDDKKSFLNKKIVVGSLIVLVALGVASVGYNAISEKNNTKELENQIERLYTSDSKDDLKKGVDSDKLEKCYSKLENIDKSERDSLEDELDTISAYLNDKEILEKINDPSYNLNSSDFESSLEKVKTSIKSYKVPSLAHTLDVLISRIEGDFKNYSIAKEKINSNIGNKNANIKELQGFVSKVNHNPNREDLQNILNNIDDEVKANKIVNDIKQSSNEKMDEVSNDISSKVDEATSSFGDKVENLIVTIKEAVSSLFEKLGNLFNLGGSN